MINVDFAIVVNTEFVELASIHIKCSLNIFSVLFENFIQPVHISTPTMK